jgi:hypothetical protein
VTPRPPDRSTARLGRIAERNAEAAILRHIAERSPSIYWTRQLATHFEHRWSARQTEQALGMLCSHRLLRTESVAIEGLVRPIQFFWPRQFRDSARARKTLRRVLHAAHQPRVWRLLGIHGEALVIEAAARAGLRLLARNVSAWEGRAWTETHENMDLLFSTRDGLLAVEVKNTLDEPRWQELNSKIDLAHHLGATPVFVVRHATRRTRLQCVRRGAALLETGQQWWSPGRPLGRLLQKQYGLPCTVTATLPDSLDWLPEALRTAAQTVGEARFLACPPRHAAISGSATDVSFDFGFAARRAA